MTAAIVLLLLAIWVLLVGLVLAFIYGASDRRPPREKP